MLGKVIPFDPKTLRHKNALREACRRDGVWFGNHPYRHFRVRRIIPHEFASLDDETRNVAIVFYDEIEHCYWRHALTAKSALPDDELFLSFLWRHITMAKQPDAILDITPFEHLMLLADAGIEPMGAA